MMTTATQLFLLSLAWIGYFVIHSLLAGRGVKHWVERHRPDLIRWYRLLYNLLAIGLLALPLGLMYGWRGELLIHWQGAMAWGMNGLALAALGLFFWTLRYYDMSEFTGTRQLAERESSADATAEHFTLSPLHRFVRHPWYALALVMLWTRNMDLMQLVSTFWATAYFVIGSRLEERKLMVYHGAVYAEYRQRVAGLFPLPWRILSRAQAQDMLQRHRRQDAPA